MSRRHADAVEVLVRDTTGRGPAPEQFLWRGRLHVVREVLARWTESEPWWEGARARAVTAGDALDAAREPALAGVALGTADLVTAAIPSSPKWAQRAWGEPAPDVGASVGPAGLPDDEREVWRVEAGAGRADRLGVYDLALDPARGTWTLTRVLD